MSVPDQNHTTAPGSEVQRGRELLGLPFYSVDEGRLLGNVEGLLVRRTDRSVPLIRVRHGGLGRPAYVPFTALKVLGPDVGLVDSHTSLLDDIPAAEIAALDTNLPGRPVLTPSGTSIGQIDGFGMDTTTGRIAYLRVKTSSGFLSRVASLVRDSTVQVPDAHIASIGPDAVILTEAGVALFHSGAPEPTASTPASV